MKQLIEELQGLASSKLEVIKTLFAMIKLEATLAGLSIFPLVLNLLMLLIILITVWTLLMLMVGYALLQIYPSTILAISSVLVLNLFFLGLLLKYFLFNLKKMSFEKTRQYLFQNKETVDNDLEKSINNRNRNDGKKIAVSPSQSE